MSDNQKLISKISELEKEIENLRKQINAKPEEQSSIGDNVSINILNAIGALVYVIDIESSKILYTNKNFVSEFGNSINKYCWEVLQENQFEPCESCFLKKIDNYTKVDELDFSWEDYSQRNKRWYRITNTLIDWIDGKKARLEVLHDITEKKESEKILIEKNTEFDKVISTVPNIVWRTKADISGQLSDMFISVAAENILNIPKGTISNNWYKYFEYIHKDDLHLILDAIKKGVIDTKPIDIQYRLIDSKGNIVPVYSKGVVERIDKNTVEAFGVTIDLTQLNRIEGELKESEEKYKTLFDFSPFPIIVHKENKVVLYNKALLKYLNTEEEKSILEKSIFEFIHPTSVNTVKDRVEKIYTKSDESLDIIHETYITPSGKVIDFEVSSAPIEYMGGKAGLVILNDITEQKKNITKLKELIATKDKFFSIIAHDLKNPFHQILGFAELLLADIDNFDKKEINKITKYLNLSALNGYKLLENLLDWSRSQTGTIRFSPEKLNVYNIIENEIALIENIAAKKGIKIINNIPTNKIYYVIADKEMYKTILRNLISNAIKFTFSGGKITVSLTEEGMYNKIEISDTGIGIHPENVDKIFRIDESLSTPGTDNEQGTGLGLTLCKEFVEKNGGEISVKSKPGKGSSFYFTLLRG